MAVDKKLSALPRGPLHWAALKMSACFSQSKRCKGVKESKKVGEGGGEPERV